MCSIDKWSELQFNSKSIEIANFKVKGIVPNWVINLYIPEILQIPYRASILNGTLSVESIKKIELSDFPNIMKLFKLFDIDYDSFQTFQWKTGKILSIDEGTRNDILNFLEELGIYTIGRFGQWNRKLLIDDTIKQAVDAIRKSKHE